MRRKYEQIICDICNKEIADVAGISLYNRDYIDCLSIMSDSSVEEFKDICIHCSNAIISTIRGLDCHYS